MSNRWERGQAPPYSLTRSSTGGTVLAASSALLSSQAGNSQLSIAGQLFPHANPVFHQGDGEAAVSGFVTPSGQEISRTDYPELFGRLATTWGIGDGSNTFNVPAVQGGVNLEGVANPGVPKPVGTVASGTYPDHDHPITVSPTPQGTTSWFPPAGTSFGFDPAGGIVYSNTETVQPVSVANPQPMQVSTSSRVIGSYVPATLAVKDSQILPVGTIIGYIGVSSNWDNTIYPWLLCDGSTFERSAYPSLFALWGTGFGSTSSTNFKVPDYRGRFMYHCNQYTSQYGNLTASPGHTSSNVAEQIPQHIHNISPSLTFQDTNTRAKAPATQYAGSSALIGNYGTGPELQTVPSNASVLWLVKAS